MNMSAYLSGFTYLLLLSPDKVGQTTNQIDTQAHLFKLPPHQQDVSWSTPAMLTKRESVTAPSMAHTGKPPPEPPPKGRLFFKSSKPRRSNISNVGGATSSPKSQLYSVQEFMQSPSSKLGPVFNSSIMGPKRIKQATEDAPAINCHDNRKYSSPLPSMNNGESTDANDCEDPREAATLIARTS